MPITARDSDGNASEVTAGLRVRVWDGSEAHADYGTVWAVQANGIVLVELDDAGGAIWPVETHEFEIV